MHSDHPRQTEDPTTKKWLGKSLIFWKLVNVGEGNTGALAPDK